MKNINKYTKAELISKMNQLKSKQLDSNISTNSNDNTIFKIIIKNILYFKTLILKITLLALIIKVFKKYSIFRRLWSIISTILFSIFGISLIDFYELEAISKFFHNILDVLSNFNSNILKFFGKTVDVPIETVTTMKSMNRINQSSTEIQENSKIIDRFNKIIHNEPIKEDILIEENTPFYKDKNTYIIIGGVIILLGLGYYYFDDIKPIGTSILAWINSFRPGPDGNGGNPGDNNPTHSNLNLRSLKDSLSRRIWGDRDDSNINPPSIHSSPSIESIQLDQLDELARERLRDFRTLNQDEIRELIEPDITGLTPITGDDFYTESHNLINEIDTFFRYQDNNTFTPTAGKLALQVAFYKTIRNRLHALSRYSNDKYGVWTRDETVNKKIATFMDLSGELWKDLHAPDQEYESDTYNEVALATVQEQDVWSNSAQSPSVQEQLLSPITNLVNEAAELDDDNDLLNKVEETFTEYSYNKEDKKIDIRTGTMSELLDNPITDNPQPENTIIFNQEGIIQSPKPDIIINNDSNSDKSSLDHYFPETQIPIVEDIRAKRIEKFEAISPNISNVGLQTPIQERLNVSPLLKKPSISNLFDDTMDLFHDDDPTGIDTSGESNKDQFIQGSSNEQIQKESSPPSLMKQIRSHRLEYGTPPDKHEIINEQTALQDSSNNEIKTKSSFMNLFEEIRAVKPKKVTKNIIEQVQEIETDLIQPENNISKEDPVTLNDWLNTIKPQIFNHDKFNRYLQIDFMDKFDEVKKLMIITNDGNSVLLDVHKKSNNTIQAFNWDEKGLSNPEHVFNDLEVVNVSLMDNEFKLHKIYENPAPNYLDTWKQNIRKYSGRDLTE